MLVVGSENTALGLLQATLAEGIPIAVNACTFRYKSAAQARGVRLRAAQAARRPWEDVGEDGVLRSIRAVGSAETVGVVAAALREAGVVVEVDERGTRLRCGEAGAVSAQAAGLLVEAQAEQARVVPTVSYTAPFSEVRLSTGRKIPVERRPA